MRSNEKTVWRCADRRNIAVHIVEGSCRLETEGERILLSVYLREFLTMLAIAAGQGGGETDGVDRRLPEPVRSATAISATSVVFLPNMREAPP